MTVSRKLTINLSPDEVAEIIKEHLAKEGFDVNETNIAFKLKTFGVGYGMYEHDETKFSGCEVTCELKQKGEDHGSERKTD